MTEAVRTYLLSVAAAALLPAVAQAILPAGAVKRTLTFCGSLLVLLAVLSPVAKLEASDMAEALSKFHLQTEFTETGVEVRNRALMEEIIIRQCREYILDKAAAMGLSPEVEITLRDDGGWPYPAAAVLRGTASPVQKAQLTRWIEENLGIPAAQQEWK